MTEKGRSNLLIQQQSLMGERRQWRKMQEDFSYDIDFFHYSAWKLQNIDEELDMIRRVLDGGECIA